MRVEETTVCIGKTKKSDGGDTRLPLLSLCKGGRFELVLVLNTYLHSFIFP